MNSVCFVLPGPSKWVSTRLRAEWPARYIPGAVVAHKGAPIPEAANYVWVKGADVEFVRAHPDAKHYWDNCDPAWWWSPTECREFISLVDGVVASCDALATDFIAWAGDALPVYTIPDRLELEHYPKRREHQRSNPVRFIWFGVQQNRMSIFGALANLERLAVNGVPLELTIYDDGPGGWQDEYYPIYHSTWSLERENEVIAAHDIAILPPYPGPWGRVKSNNKHLTAWACGLPVSDGLDYDLLRWLATDPVFRQDAANLGLRTLCADYDVQDSAAEWRRLLNV